jgi:hypothetical protein
VSHHDLARVYQKNGELSEVRNCIPNILEYKVISAFVRGLYHHDELLRKFNRKPPVMINEMF